MTNADARTERAAAEVAAKHLGAAGQRVMGRDTDAYSLAQFAKATPPTIPAPRPPNPDARGTISSIMVSSDQTFGTRCYRMTASPGYKSIKVRPETDADALALLLALVPDLEDTAAHPARDVINFPDLCDVVYKYQSQGGGISRLALVSIVPRAPKKTAHVVEEKPVSDVETWFGPKTAKRAPWGAEGDGVKADSKPYSVKNHFRRELLKLRYDADPADFAFIVLGMTIEESCEKIGVSPTIDKLQVHLDKPEENPVVSPITNRPTTKDIDAARKQISALFADAGIVSADALKAAYREATGDESLIASVDAGKVLDFVIADVEAFCESEKALAPKQPETHAVYAASAPVAPLVTSKGRTVVEGPPITIGVPPTPNGATAGHAEGQGGASTSYPNYPESPVVVYPMQNGGVVYKSIRFSVTMRLGGTWAMALVLMDDFAAHREFIDPSCIVHAPIASAGGSAAPAVPMLPMTAPVPAAPAGAAPDSKGRVPGQGGADAIAYVCRSVVNGAETIELWQATGKWPEHKMRRDNEKAMLVNVGINYAAMDAGTKYPCKLSAAWVTTANKSEKDGKFTYYRDVTAITQTA